jgi:hypothetical protein
MTLTSILNGPVAGSMAPNRMETYTYTTTAAAAGAYEVIGTVATANYPGVCNSIYVTTNNLLFKFEFTRDGVTWLTSIEDYPIAAAGNAQLSAVRQAIQYRVSVKPAVAGNHGSCTWIFSASQVILPPEYRSAFAYEALAITNAAAVPLTVATAQGAFTANITVEGNPVRVRWDGTAPTTTEGHLLQSGDSMKLDFTADIWKFRAIATGANATLRVTYSR